MAAAARRPGFHRGAGALLSLLLTLLTAACAGGEDAAEGDVGAAVEVLDGYLVYREALILPPEAWADIRLLRLDADGEPVDLIAAAEVPGPLLPVTPFRLLYDPSYVNDGSSGALGVAAAITVRRLVLFRSERPVPVSLPRPAAADPLVVPLYGQWNTVDVGG